MTLEMVRAGLVFGSWGLGFNLEHEPTRIFDGVIFIIIRKIKSDKYRLSLKDTLETQFFNDMINKLILTSAIMISVHAVGQKNDRDTLTIRPGSNHLNYRAIKPYVLKSEFKVIKDGKETNQGLYIDSVYFVTSQNSKQKLLYRVGRFPARNLIDTAVYDAATLTPVSNREFTPQGNVTIKYASDAVSVNQYISSKDSTILTEQQMDQPYFDGYANDFIFRYLKQPKSDQIIRMPLYSFSKKKIAWIAISVTEQEWKKANEKSQPCWIFHLVWEGTTAATDFYVSKKDRRLLRMHQVVTGSNTQVIKETVN